MPKTKMLTRDQEMDLARAWLDHGDERARARLVRAYQPMIVRIAKKHHRPGVDLQDLIQEGNIGFLGGLDNFEPDRGYSIGTLARFHIGNKICIYLGDTGAIVRIPNSKRIRRLLSAVIRPIREIEALHGVKLTAAEESSICEDEGFTHAELENYRAVHGVPCGIEAGGDEDESGSELADVSDTPEDALLVSRSLEASQRAVAGILSSLPAKTQKIVAMRHLSDEFVSLDSIAEELGMTREGVRKSEAAAVDKIRTRLIAEGFTGLGDVLDG